jgi:dephospho-CoA kinase
MADAERAAIAAAPPPGPIVVHDVPLLAESRGKGGFDQVIVVDVPPETQVERLVGQRGMSPDAARARMAAQASREQRLAVADIVIDNSGTLSDLDRAVTTVWGDLEHLLASRPAPDRPPGS